MEDPVLARSHDTARAAGSGIPTSAEALGGLIEGALAAAMQRQAAANGTRSFSNAVLPTPAQLVGASMPARVPLPTISAGNSGIGDEEEEPGSPWADGGRGGHGETKNSNRKLSSRFRGVCWNKKNKRWQSAINSGGRYLYLGSYTNEDDAARAFDKAAIKIRGRKAKLNFTYDDYTDENGDFIDDIVLPDPPAAKASKRKPASARNDAAEQLQLLAGQLAGNRVVTDGDGAGGSAGGRNARFGVYGESFNAAFRNAAAMLQPAMLQPARPDGLGLGVNAGAGFGAASAGQAVRGYLQDAGLLVRMGNGSTSQQGHYEAPLPAAQQQGAPPNLQEVVRQLPPNCSVDDVLPGNESVFGIIYKHEASAHTGACGCAVWNGVSLNDDGMYNSERDARQSCAAAVAALLGRSGGQAAWQQQQQRRATALDGLSNLGIVEALALAARAAAEEAGQDSHGNGAPSDGGDGAAPSSSAPARVSNGGDGRSSDDARGPFGSSGGDGRGGDPYGSSYGGDEYAPTRSSFRRRSGSQSLDNAPDAPAPKRARVDPGDGPATAAGARDLSGMPPLGPTTTAALQGGAGGGGSGSGGSALSAMERLCNLNLTDMLRQMAQAAAARGSSAAAGALEDALAGPQQQQQQQQEQPALSS